MNAELFEDVQRPYVDIDPSEVFGGADHRVYEREEFNMDRAAALREFAKRDLSERARAVVAEVPADVLARTAAFLLLKDSRSSFEIEGEHPPQERIQNWGRAIGEAGRQPIDLDELLRLQRYRLFHARDNLQALDDRRILSRRGFFAKRGP
jgi:hypothetical protein